MMKIKDIKFISVAAKEAELIVSDGINECLVFSQPCALKIGEEFFEPIKVLDVENLIKAINKKESIRKSNESYFAHHCIAKIVDKEARIVAIGNIKMELECIIPGWANEGDLLEFTCSRLDIW